VFFTLGRCIGERNHRWFILLLLSAGLCNAILLAADIVAIHTDDNGVNSIGFIIL
jgi:hypothetical protein